MANHAHGGISDDSSGHAIFFGGWVDCSPRVGYLFALSSIHAGSGFHSKARRSCASRYFLSRVFAKV